MRFGNLSGLPLSLWTLGVFNLVVAVVAMGVSVHGNHMFPGWACWLIVNSAALTVAASELQKARTRMYEEMARTR
jgi:uncharacterized membrane protein YvlD (DUF360 family)